jgi:hypothetical protein
VDVPQAATILSAYQEARALLIGKSVALTNGRAGTVESVWLDELHGLPRLETTMESGLSRP